MDSQHRHELQENQLADWLGRQIEAIKPHAPLIIFGLLAAVVAIAGIKVYNSANASSEAAAWGSYSIAVEGNRPNLSVLENTAQDYAGTNVAEVADITWADGQLYIASQTFLRSRDAADEALEKAKDKYNKLRAASDARIRDRAVFGLARVAELEGDVDEATKLYGKVTGAFEELAKDRIEDLAMNQTKADYDWLAQVQPTRRSAPAGPGTPGVQPEFSPDMLETPGSPPAVETPAIDPPAEK